MKCLKYFTLINFESVYVIRDALFCVQEHIIRYYLDKFSVTCVLEGGALGMI